MSFARAPDGKALKAQAAQPCPYPSPANLVTVLRKQSRAVATAHREEGFLPTGLIKRSRELAEDRDGMPTGWEEVMSLTRTVGMGLTVPCHRSEELQHKRGGEEGRSLGHHCPLLLLHLAPLLALQCPAASCRAPGWASRSLAVSSQAKDLHLCISWLWDVAEEITRAVQAQVYWGRSRQILHTLETIQLLQYSSLKCWSMGMREMSLLRSRACNYKSF